MKKSRFKTKLNKSFTMTEEDYLLLNRIANIRDMSMSAVLRQFIKMEAQRLDISLNGDKDNGVQELSI